MCLPLCINLRGDRCLGGRSHSLGDGRCCHGRRWSRHGCFGSLLAFASKPATQALVMFDISARFLYPGVWSIASRLLARKTNPRPVTRTAIAWLILVLLSSEPVSAQVFPRLEHIYSNPLLTNPAMTASNSNTRIAFASRGYLPEADSAWPPIVLSVVRRLRKNRCGSSLETTTAQHH